MRRRALLAVILVLAVLFSGCSGGEVSQVNKIIGDSEVYSRAEIGRAMNVVIRCFKNGFEGCTLTELEYDEEISEKYSSDWAEKYDADEGIVLISSFHVDASGGDGSLEPNSTYKNYQWVLTRSGITGWKLQTWGYA